MKKIFLLLFIPFILSAQNWIPQGNGYTYTVTIQYGATATADMDSVETVDFDLQYGDLAEIWMLGNSNATGDSVAVRSGGKSILVAGATPSDTAWGNRITLKDSSWSVKNVLINNTVGTHYFINEPLIDVLQFELINYRAALTTRSVTMVIKTKKTTIE